MPESVEQLLRVVHGTACKAKDAGLDYQRDWLAAWPRGMDPNPRQNGPIMDVAQRLRDAIAHEEASSAANGRGVPGYNVGYQYWVRAWPDDPHQCDPYRDAGYNREDWGRSPNYFMSAGDAVGLRFR